MLFLSRLITYASETDVEYFFLSHTLTLHKMEIREKKILRKEDLKEKNFTVQVFFIINKKTKNITEMR